MDSLLKVALKKIFFAFWTDEKEVYPEFSYKAF